MTPQRTILHVDMDAFFAAIEQLDHPELRGKPVVVGSPPNRRGVVSTCSYEARKYGIHSAMPSRTAYGRCPHAIFVPVRGERYRQVSRQVMEVFHSFTPLVEQVSIDEAFLDVTSVLKRWADAVVLARELKTRIREKTGLTGSVGIAPNKFLAKLASDMDKPDGLTVTPFEPGAIREFLAPLPVARLWGVGRSTAAKLKTYGIQTVHHLQERPLDQLIRLLGENHGRHLHRLAFGLDDRPIETEQEEKSISHEETFVKDVVDGGVLRKTLIDLAERVGTRLRKLNRKCRTAFIKVRFEDFTTITRQRSRDTPTSAERTLVKMALDIWQGENVWRPVRLIGFGVSNLTDVDAPGEQPELFDDIGEAENDEAQERLDAAVDELRGKFGRDIIRRGG